MKHGTAAQVNMDEFPPSDVKVGYIEFQKYIPSRLHCTRPGDLSKEAEKKARNIEMVYETYRTTSFNNKQYC
jgi:hypothetical protein